jgi:hypothetical protein
MTAASTVNVTNAIENAVAKASETLLHRAENKRDLSVAAHEVTPQTVNFMQWDGRSRTSGELARHLPSCSRAH